MRKFWSDDEINFIINNYRDLGNLECTKMLNRSIDAVSSKAHCLSLKLNNDIRSEIAKKAFHYKNNFKSDLNNINADFAYILGFIWADGYVDKNYNNVKISCVLEDILEIEHIFYNTGNWLSYIA